MAQKGVPKAAGRDSDPRVFGVDELEGKSNYVSQDFETSRRATPIPGTITNRAAFVNFHPPLRFEPNVGQSAKNVRFLARGKGFTLLLGPTEATLFLQDYVSTSPKTAATQKLELGTGTHNSAQPIRTKQAEFHSARCGTRETTLHASPKMSAHWPVNECNRDVSTVMLHCRRSSGRTTSAEYTNRSASRATEAGTARSHQELSGATGVTSRQLARGAARAVFPRSSATDPPSHLCSGSG